MRTTLDIDDLLLEALMARSPGMSKTKAIERAIDHFVKTDAYERVRELRGAFPDMSRLRILRRGGSLARSDRPYPCWAILL